MLHCKDEPATIAAESTSGGPHQIVDEASQDPKSKKAKQGKGGKPKKEKE